MEDSPLTDLAPRKDGGPAAKPPAAKPEEKPPEEVKPEEIEAFIKQYEEQLSKMTDEDAIAGIGKLKGWYLNPRVGEEGKKAILKVFQSKVVKVRGKEAYLEAAAKALGEMGGEEAIPLLRYLVESSLGQKIQVASVARAGIASLGRIASVKGDNVKYLTEKLKKEDEFIGDAARALAGYAKAPGAVRREIFEELLKMCEGVYSKSEANDVNMKRKWNIWGTEVVEAMQKVTGQNFTKPPEFRRWLNNKDPGGGKNPKTWADPEGGKTGQ